MKKIRILIADDHDVVRSGLKMLLRSSPDFSVIAEATDGDEAVRLAGSARPDVAILDISMPKLDGIGATRVIREKYPSVKIIILSVHEDQEYVHEILRAGASGYLLKNASKREIFEAVRSTMQGERFFSHGISRLIIDGFIRQDRARPGDHQEEAAPKGEKLTRRETEILQYIAQGYTNREIADTLFLSFRTVNTHRANLMQKLDIHDTAGLVRHAITLGLVKATP